MREWRRISGRAVEPDALVETWDDVAEWTRRGEQTCRAVYGSHYEKLRQNIRALHPALDAWMITEGYGKVLSRGALDLLCASCASSPPVRSRAGAAVAFAFAWRAKCRCQRRANRGHAGCHC